jgi:hypothetical protein
MERFKIRREASALVAFQFAWWLERMSRRFFTPASKPPIARFHQVRTVRSLPLEQPVYAACKPPTEYVFISQDEYFHRVERVLESST